MSGYTWGGFRVTRDEVDKLTGLLAGTEIGLSRLKHYEELGEDTRPFYQGFEIALDTLTGPRHGDGVDCVGLRGTDDTPFIEYVVPDEERREAVKDAYRQARDVGEDVFLSMTEDEEMSLDSEDVETAIENLEDAYDYLNERRDMIEARVRITSSARRAF